MFHFKQLCGNGMMERESYDIEVGDVVKSRYKAAWTGKVVSLNPDGGCAEVLVLWDRHDNPMKKTKVVSLHVHWLRVDKSRRLSNTFIAFAGE